MPTQNLQLLRNVYFSAENFLTYLDHKSSINIYAFLGNHSFCVRIFSQWFMPEKKKK